MPRISLLIALVTLVCAAVYADEPVTFSAMGDGPYDVKDWNRLRHQIGHENREAKARFIIHVGDIARGTDALPESRYTRVAEILKGADMPLFIIPGDNEWNDLDDPAVGWAYWVKHYTDFEQHFDVPWDVSRQGVRRENFAFVLDGVLFVGVNLVGGTVHDPAEWQTRHEQDAAWVREQLESHGTDVRAAVIFGHAQPNEKHESFFSAAIPVIEAFAKPTLYLHGDGHFWQKKEAWRVANLWRVQIDKIGEGPPVRVTVTRKARKPFEFDRQLDERDSDLYESMSKRILRKDGFGRSVRPR